VPADAIAFLAGENVPDADPERGRQRRLATI
jgi:hypothetical protein